MGTYNERDFFCNLILRDWESEVDEALWNSHWDGWKEELKSSLGVLLFLIGLALVVYFIIGSVAGTTYLFLVTM